MCIRDRYKPQVLFSRTIYNKGAWVLHMLRRELGDDNFFNLLKEYYSKYKYRNSSTVDFISLSQSFSEKNLDKFFEQWVISGIGKLELEYSFSQQEMNSTFMLNLKLVQKQEGYESYEFILDIDFYDLKGNKISKTINVSRRQTEYEFVFDNRITDIDLDPDNWLASKINYKE
jgi:aminopeptidase N